MSGLSNNNVVVCYIGTWSVYRQAPAKFEIENLDPTLCTHAIYAFAGLDESTYTIKSLDPWQDLPDNGGKNGYNRLTNMKKNYPNLKVSLAIGGWNEGSTKYSAMARDSSRRRTFINSVVNFLNKYNFDGLDLDWEYPTKRGGSSNDKQNFALLCQELKEAFNGKYILTAALSAGKDTIAAAYDVPKISASLDFIHMMTYDYHGAWDGRTGANSPYNEMMATVDYMIQLGADPKKTSYGYTALRKNIFIFGNKRTEEIGREGSDGRLRWPLHKGKWFYGL